MEKLIYRFLDDSIGGGIKIKKSVAGRGQLVYSDSNKRIFGFRLNEDGSGVYLYRYPSLCRTISALFSVDENSAAKIVGHWFADKNGINKISDILKYIPTN
jgi:hypothetical protein